MILRKRVPNKITCAGVTAEITHYDDYGNFKGVSIIDKEDIIVLGGKSWSLCNGYVFRLDNKKILYLHRVIMSAPSDMVVDHINRIRTDNRRSNLRIVSGEENRKNKSIYSTSTTGIAGVHYRAKIDKYEVVLSIDNKKIYCGRYNSLAEAIAARQAGPKPKPVPDPANPQQA